MTSSTLINLAIGLGLIAYVGYRQFTWRLVDPARLWKLPLILGAAGILTIARQHLTVHPIDVVILGLSAVFALVSGALMGRIARFRPAAADPRFSESRTGWLGVAIWAGLIAVRVGLDILGHRMGSDLAVSTGSILLVVALNRTTNAVVLSTRQPRRAYAMTQR
jgi:hypothetical protein